jgi:predicted outer membrane protein
MVEKHWTRMSLAVAAVLFAAACAKGDNAGGDTATDSGSVSAATSAPAADRVDPSMVMAFLHTVDEHEVQSGRVAQTKATNAKVRDYAKMMVTDHCRSLTMAAAMSGGAAAPAPKTGASASAAPSTAECDRAIKTGSTGTATSPAPAGNTAQSGDIAQMHQANEQEMKTLESTAKGAKFDSTYIAAMVAGHQTVLQRLESMRGTGGSASGGASATAAGGTTAAPATNAPAGTGNAGAAASAGTTQPAGTVNEGDAMQSHLQAAITMVRTHLERAQEIQRTLAGNK